jgi:hypothetical protein
MQFAICNLQFAICNLQFAICNFRFLFYFLITTNFDRIVQYSSKYCIIVQFHNAFSILHHCMHPCNAALPVSIARQPCPEALPGSLARPGSLACQPCPPALQKSLQAVLPP